MTTKINIKKEEVLRYLGYGGKAADTATQKLMEEVLLEAAEVFDSKSIYQVFPCILQAGNIILLGDMKIVSDDLYKNLTGCKKAILMAVTLGQKWDKLARRYAITNLAKAAIFQAVGAATIEQVCDDLEEQIKKEHGFFWQKLRPRFSPGYGDFSLKYQKDIFKILECEKRIGLSLTEGYMMVPAKSITAIIGIADEKEKKQQQNCNGCTQEQCIFGGDRGKTIN